MSQPNSFTVESLLQRAVPVPIAGCWLWEQHTTPDGYGRVKFKGKDWTVTRLMMTLKGFTLRTKDRVMHMCDVPSCINPVHLIVGTDADNTADSINKGRRIKAHRVHAKLTDVQVLEIRTKLRSGEKIAALAKEYGVARSTLGNIASGQTWKEVIPGFEFVPTRKSTE